MWVAGGFIWFCYQGESFKRVSYQVLTRLELIRNDGVHHFWARWTCRNWFSQPVISQLMGAYHGTMDHLSSVYHVQTVGANGLYVGATTEILPDLATREEKRNNSYQIFVIRKKTVPGSYSEAYCIRKRRAGASPTRGGGSDKRGVANESRRPYQKNHDAICT